MRMRKGFSLVELSIVLVILGLLVGGILAGRSLIRASELRSVTTQHRQYITATRAFRDKYFALPGDITNAQSIWGAAHATPATCVTTASSSPLTCNGNGDGIINVSTGSNESYRFWQQLTNAGLLEGQYSGISDSGGNSYTTTANNSPAGRLNNSFWFVWNFGATTGNVARFDGNYRNVFEFGTAVTNGDPNSPIFTPAEMWNIDVKMDDGKPATGTLVVRAAGGLSACTTTVSNDSTTLTADYLLTAAGTTCAAIFMNPFG